MKSLKKILEDIFLEVIGNIFPEYASIDILEIAQAGKAIFGHYQCNSPLKIAKKTGEQPREIANKMLCVLKKMFPDMCDDAFSKIDIGGAGFINVEFSKSFLTSRLLKVISDPYFGIDPVGSQKVVIDFSSPNIAKELHVGHLRSTIIGDCLARIFEWLDFEVLRLNHVGDWGTSFGMLINYIEEEKLDVDSGKLSDLEGWYFVAKKRFDSDDNFKKMSQRKVVNLQSGDEGTMDMWRKICQISRKGFEEIYDLLEVNVKERGESFYNPLLPKIVSDLESKGLLKISCGAKCVYLDDFYNKDGDPLPFIVQKSDGGYNYSTTDLAAMHHRIFVEKANRIIIVTDLGQSLHFKMVRGVAKLAGYLSDDVVFDHVTFGLVLQSEGKKFSTRSGNTQKLIDLLHNAISMAKEILRKREDNLEDIDESAKILGINAIKYADLSNNRNSDYSFSYEKMLNFDGNTAPFLMYAYVRIKSIKEKSGVDVEKIVAKGKLTIEFPEEIDLVLHIQRFQEVIEIVAKTLLPHKLAEYLYKLAEKFHVFFQKCRVINSEAEDSRLVICEATGKVLKKGLELLGLKTLDKM